MIIFIIIHIKPFFILDDTDSNKIRHISSHIAPSLLERFTHNRKSKTQESDIIREGEEESSYKSSNASNNYNNNKSDIDSLSLKMDNSAITITDNNDHTTDSGRLVTGSLSPKMLLRMNNGTVKRNSNRDQFEEANGMF